MRKGTAHKVRDGGRWAIALAVSGLMAGGLVPAGTVSAATFTWNGPAGASWSAANAWSPGPIPNDGTAFLRFTQASTGNSVANSFSVQGINYTSTANNLTLSGPFTLGNLGITDDSTGTTSISSDITLSASQAWRTAGFTRLTSSGRVRLNGNALTVNAPTAGVTFQLGGFTTLNGSGSLSLNGAGNFNLLGSIDMTGSLSLAGGYLNLTPSFYSARINGPVSVSSGTIQVSGDVDLVGNSLTIGTASSSVTTLSMTTDGTLSVGSLVLGGAGAATVIHSYQVINAASVQSAQSTGSSMGYTLYDGATVQSTGDILLGVRGQSTVNQTAGQFGTAGTLTLGQLAGSQSSYTLSGGTLSAANLVVGQGGASGGVGTFTQTGGTLTVSNSLSVGTGSSLRFSVPGSTNSYSSFATVPSVTVGVSGAATGSASVTLGTTTRTGSAPVRASALVVNSVTLQPGSTSGTYSGVVDLGNNDLIVGSGTSLETLRQYISAYKLAGTKSGLGSSVSSPSAYTTLALVPNVDGFGRALYSTFDGVSGLTTSHKIIKFTYVGDTNLDGILDGQDYRSIYEGYLFGLSGWTNGDVDNSGGAVSLSDLNSFLSAYSWYTQQSNPTRFGSGTEEEIADVRSIPEPAGVVTLLAAGVPAMRRRRR